MARWCVQSSVLGKQVILLAALAACACVGVIHDGDGDGGTEGEGVEKRMSCGDDLWPVCVDDANIRLCVSGYYEVHACAWICELHGYAGGGECTLGDCQCGAAKNAKCASGAAAVCACIGCADGELGTAYASCELGQNSFVACFAEWVKDGLVDCAAANQACL
jgi:hypothetical protein